MKKCSKALSILLAILMVASTMFVASAAETSAILTGTELIINEWYGTNNDTLGSPTKGEAYIPGKDASPLIPEFPSTRLTFGWNKEESKFGTLEEIYEDNSNAKVMRYNDSIVVDTDFVYDEDNSKYFIDIYNGGAGKGLMFYIKLHEKSEQTNIYLEGLSVGFNENKTIVTASNKVTQNYNRIIGNDKDVYLMPAGTNGWDEAVIGALGNGEKKSLPSICLDGGFEGWVYIPASSWIDPAKVSTLKYLYRVNWYVSRLVDGEDFQISNLMVVDGDVTTAAGVNVDGLEYIFNDNRYYSATALNVSNPTTSMADVYEMGLESGKLAPSYGAANSSLNPTLSTDSLSQKINPASLYIASVAGTNLVQNLDAAKRPKDSTGWSFFNIAAAGIEGRNLYNMSFKSINPFNKDNTKVYDSATTNSKISNKTYGEQFTEIFDVDSTDGTPTAYVGGPYKMIGYDNNGGASYFAGINPSDFAGMSMDGKSILLYVKHTYNNIEEADKQPMNATILLGDFSTRNGYTYYSYDNKNKVWEEKTLQKPDVVGGLNESRAGGVELDKDFEGWIMIPASSLWKNAADRATEWAEFRFSPECFGGIYGEVTLGDIAILDFESPLDVASGSQFVSANENALVDDFPFEQPMEKTADAEKWTKSGVNGFKDANDKALLTVTEKTFTADAAFVAPTTTTGSGDNKEVFYEASGLTRVEFNTQDGEILTAQNNKSFALKVDNSKGGELEAIFGSNYLYMSPGSTYYLLDESDTEWEAKESTSTYTLTVGTTVAEIKVASITIPEGFVGWVSVPFEYLTVGNNKIQNESRQFYRADFHPVKMTGLITINGLALFSTEVPSAWYYDNGICKGMNSKIGDLSEYSADNEKYITVANGVLTSDYDGLYTSLKVSGSIAEGEALMFYAKNDADAAISFNTSIGDNTTVMGYTLSDRSWTSLSSQDGKIVIPIGFDGWVKIAVTQDTDFDSIKIMFRSLKNGLALSDFMVLNQSEDLDKIKTANGHITGLFYTKGDFNIDEVVDIRDLVCAGAGEIKHDITKFGSEEDDQVARLKQYLLDI